MRTRTRNLIAIVFSAALISPVAFSQGASGKDKPKVQATDADKDGFLTSEEYREFYTHTASQGEQHATAHSSVLTRDVWTRLERMPTARSAWPKPAAMPA